VVEGESFGDLLLQLRSVVNVLSKVVLDVLKFGHNCGFALLKVRLDSSNPSGKGSDSSLEVSALQIVDGSDHILEVAFEH